MMTWQTHYNKAEEYLKRADDLSIGVNVKTMLLARAQVHATLATVRVTEKTRVT